MQFLFMKYISINFMISQEVNAYPTNKLYTYKIYICIYLICWWNRSEAMSKTLRDISLWGFNKRWDRQPPEAEPLGLM